MSALITYGRRGARRQRRNTQSKNDYAEDSDTPSSHRTRPETPRTPSKRLQVEVVIPPSPYSSKSSSKSPLRRRSESPVKRSVLPSPKRTPVVELVKRKRPGSPGATKQPLGESHPHANTFDDSDEDLLPTFPPPSKRTKIAQTHSTLTSTSTDPLDMIDRFSQTKERTPSRRSPEPRSSTSRPVSKRINARTTTMLASEDVGRKPRSSRGRSSATPARSASETRQPSTVPQTKAEKTSNKVFYSPSPSPGPSRSAVKPKSTRAQTPRRTTVLRASSSMPIAPSPSSTPDTPLRRTRTEPRASASVSAFSDLFDFTAPSVPRPSVQPAIPVAKRMLARTRTELSLDTGADALQSLLSASTISRTSSTQDVVGDSHVPDDVLPLIPPPTRPQAVPLVQQNSNPGAVSGSGSGIRTYAGLSRSFLAAQIPAGLDDLDVPTPESYADLRARWGVDYSELDPLPRPISTSPPLSSSTPTSAKAKGKGRAQEVPKRRADLAPNMMNDVRSITELRTKGEARRFVDEVGYLFEGMEVDASIGVRRASALEIVTKLCDTDFARRAKSTDFMSRAWTVLRSAGAGDGDRVLDAALTLFAALVSRSRHDVDELAREGGFLDVMCELLGSLGRGRDPLAMIEGGKSETEFRQMGLGKPERLSLSTLRSVLVKKSGLTTSEDTAPPLRELISLALTSVSPHLLYPSHLPALHTSLLSELSLLPQRLSAYAAGLPLLPDGLDSPQLAHAEHCISALDTFLLGRWADAEERVPLCDAIINGENQEELCNGLVALCAVARILYQTSEDEDVVMLAGRCLESTLRVLINLSHDNSSWCNLLLAETRTVPLMVALVATYDLSLKPANGTSEDIEMPDVRANGAHDETVNDDEHRLAAVGGAPERATDDDAREQSFDRLCLALGLLMNLVQADKRAKDVVRETTLNPACPLTRHCTQGCRCADRIGALDVLARLYARTRTSADDRDVMLRGHLAVLLGLLMRSEENVTALLKVLPGITRRARLNALVGHVGEFIALYEEFMGRVVRGDGEEEGGVGEKAAKNREAGQDVARDVMAFLQGLSEK